MPPLLPRLATLMLGLALVAIPSHGQNAPQLEGVGGSRQAVTLDGAAVPYAARADALLRGLARMQASDLDQGSDQLAVWLRTVGLEPASDAARHLVELAVTAERQHPLVTEAMKRQAKAAGEADFDIPSAWIEARYAIVGRAFGTWLHARRADGWAVEPLIDHLLNGEHLRVALFSDEPEAAFLKRVEGQALAFRRAVTVELGSLPKRLEQQ
ncbi:MAG: hypothetical protein AAGE94_11255 [Acidobacteriota bacterium]